ncbi:hypothetical protein [Flocculibacter collagenilyticus]|uniref:hypothetical protein n=1 Tax=Flocculibacter collagenilyticus TaxID=2744479 RepID=UPI0018F35708|nr:hypothetical protein [Flocculibacter collagenilyticus]
MRSMVAILMSVILCLQSMLALAMPCNDMMMNSHHNNAPIAPTPSITSESSTSHCDETPKPMTASLEQLADDCCDTECSCPNSACHNLVLLNKSATPELMLTPTGKVISAGTNLLAIHRSNLFRPPITA